MIVLVGINSRYPVIAPAHHGLELRRDLQFDLADKLVPRGSPPRIIPSQEMNEGFIKITPVIHQFRHIFRPRKRPALHEIQVEDAPDPRPVRVGPVQYFQALAKRGRIGQHTDAVEHPVPITVYDPFGLLRRHSVVICMKPYLPIHFTNLSLKIYHKNFVFVTTYLFHSRPGSCASLYSHSRQSACMTIGARLIWPAT